MHAARPVVCLAVAFLSTAALAVRLQAESKAAVSDPLPRGSHGEEPWALFPEGQVPGTQTAKVPEESFSRADPHNWVGMLCSPTGRAEGNYYYNTVVPTLVPHLVDRSDPNFVDAVVVVAPGGGHDHLAFNVTGTDVARWLNTLGISAVVLKYRVPARAWKEGAVIPEMDGQRAVSLMRSRATELGFSPSKVGLMGASAGGDLAVRVGTAAERAYPRVDAVDDVSFRPDFMILLHPGVVATSLSGASRAPSSFIAMAADDPCASPSIVTDYYHAMKQQGAPASELHIYSSGRHGYGTCNMYPAWRSQPVCEWTKRAEAYLTRRLTLKAPAASFSAASASWCPPPSSACKPLSKCVGHCDTECWSAC